MLEVKKQQTESSQSLIRRFTRGMQQSGILFGVRKRQFKQKTKSRLAKKNAAIRREKSKIEYEKLRKLGKLEKKTNVKGRH